MKHRDRSVALGGGSERRAEKDEEHAGEEGCRRVAAAASEDARQAVIFRRRLSLSLACANERKELALHFISAHPDVVLLVHQGTDLVNREPVGGRGRKRERGEEEREGG